MFGRSGEFAEKYFHQGMRISVSGRIQTGNYTNKDGVRVYTTEVIVEEQEFAESRAESEGNRGTTRQQVKPEETPDIAPDGFMWQQGTRLEGMPMEQRLEENNVKNENNLKKEYLRGYRSNRRRINRIDDEVTELRELAASVKATNYSGMPHGSGKQKDLSDELARIDTLEKRLEQEREKCVESYISIENLIKSVKNEDENDVLFYRYIKGLRFWEIAEKMDCSEQWVHKLHGRALGRLKIQK